MESILRRERAILATCLAAMVILSWLYLLQMARDMSGMDMPDMSMVALPQWDASDLILLFVMWTVMMVAMMVPSAAPMTLAFLSLNQRRQGTTRTVVPTYIFVLGYLAMWSAYSALATLAQWGLHEGALISASMIVTSPYLSGGILIAAGVFQWTPIKRACLAGCRSPLSFLMSEWREGKWGAFVMGVRHGSYCVGCCWILMALLFVTGVMNLLAVAVIAVFVIAEKLLARGELFGRMTGGILVVSGLVAIARAW